MNQNGFAISSHFANMDDPRKYNIRMGKQLHA